MVKDDSNPDRQGRPDDRVERVVKSSERLSKVAPYIDLILQWRAENMGTRAIARRLEEEKGFSVSFNTVAREIARRIRPVAIQTIQKAEVRASITRELIESHFGRILAEAEAGFEEARELGDTDRAQRWMALWEKTVHDLAAKFIPSPTPAALAKETEGRMSAEEFWRRVKWRE